MADKKNKDRFEQVVINETPKGENALPSRYGGHKAAQKRAAATGSKGKVEFGAALRNGHREPTASGIPGEALKKLQKPKAMAQTEAVKKKMQTAGGRKRTNTTK